MPNKTPGERLVEEWMGENGSYIAVVPAHLADLSHRINTLLSTLTRKAWDEGQQAERDPVESWVTFERFAESVEVQSAGLVLDLMTVRKMQAGKMSKGEFVPENWYSEAELLDAIRTQLPDVKVRT